MRFIISIAIILLLSGCADLGYYWHSASGHLGLMSKRVDIDELLADEALDASLRERLLLVGEIRAFAVNRLALPGNGSYDSYVQLDKPYVLQNLFAAAEFSTQLHSWCYPIVGCTSYRGYYDDDRLQRYAKGLEESGLEVYLGPVSAYSTLGWFDDPVLSSFIDWPEYRLAGLLFHELTHQRIYIDDDTTFNESLASAVQRAGTELWLTSNRQLRQLDEYHRWNEYRDRVIALIVASRNELALLYESDASDSTKRGEKALVFERARVTHLAIAARYGVEQGFTRWFAGALNNAKIGSIAAYNEQSASFLAILDAHQLDFEHFFEYVAKLGKLDAGQRKACLQSWRDIGTGPETQDICS